MRLAIPSETNLKMESDRSGHFGHAPYFTVVTFDKDMNITQVEAMKNVDHDQVGCGGVINFVANQKFDAILAAGIGARPVQVFSAAGTKVYIDTTAQNVGDAVKLFVEGKVHEVTPADVCQH